MNVGRSGRSNWPVKLGAFLVGIALWMHVKTDQRYEGVISLPLQVSEPSGRFVVANETPATVKVRVMGNGKDLLFRRPHGRVVVRPRVSAREPMTVELSADQIEGVDESVGIEVLDIESPRSILLDFDYFDTREVPVIPRIGIQPRAGYTLVGRVRTEPRTVRVGGPRRYVREIESVETDSLVISDVESDIDRIVSVAVPQGENLMSTPQKVTIRAEVQLLLERRFADVPVRVVRVPRGTFVQVIPERVTVEVIGGEKVVSAVSQENVQVELDYRERFEHGLDDLPLTVSLPRYVQLVRVSPATASLVLGKREPRRR